MSVEITKKPNGYVFAGNPVVFEMATDNQDEIIVSVIAGNNPPEHFSLIPSGSGPSYAARIDIGGFLKSFFLPYEVDTTEPVSLLENFALDYHVSITFGDTMSFMFDGVAFRGGVSEYVFGALADEYLDIFSFRLADFTRQYLFTNRTHDDVIHIRENELYSVPFIHPGGVIRFESDAGNIIYAKEFPERSICSMNFPEISSLFENQFREITSSIKVITLDSFFTVVIEPSYPSEERYGIRFMNSIGAYEIIEVTGKAYQDPQYGEENTWLTSDKYSFLEERRDRMVMKDRMEVSTGYKKRIEFPFLLDMITSDEIYFISPDGKERRCHITCENMKYAYRMTVPTAFNLDIRFVNEEEYNSLLPDITFFVLASEDGAEIITETTDQNISVKK